MKKLISVILVVTMMLTLAVPAMAITNDETNINASRSKVPVIRISGDGEPLYNKDGDRIMHFRGLLDNFKGDDSEEGNNELYESMANVLLPFLIDGMLTDNWDAFYENLNKEIAELFGDALLDNNGNAINGTGLAQDRIDEMNYNMANDKSKHFGRDYYAWNDYWFRYDWRLDPWEIADDFHTYVEAIKKSTGKPKVSVIATCLGSNVVMAYMAKYGTDSLHGVGFDGIVVNGAEILSETISAKFRVNGNAVNRALKDCASYGLFDVGSFVISTIDLLEKTNVMDTAIGMTEEALYYKLVEGVTSALALSTFFTWPNYWGAVSVEDYDDALHYVFGPEGSEKRTEYAGLIAKLQNYHENVRLKIPAIMKSLEVKGVKVAIISKYGSQIVPVCESSDVVSDQFASVKRTSFGATTSSIYETLSGEYIAQREAEGKGKYISPDKQIDASTCIYPDYTFFIKGATHSNWTPHEMKILYDVITADTQLTVEDFPQYSQFFIYKSGVGAEKMTTENCHTEAWTADKDEDMPQDQTTFIVKALKSLMIWLKEAFIFIKNLIVKK